MPKFIKSDSLSAIACGSELLPCHPSMAGLLWELISISQAQHARPEGKQSPVLDIHQRNVAPSSCPSASLPCSCQPGAGLALASFWQLPLQLCGLQRWNLCSDLALRFWGFSPHDRFPKSVVFVIFQVAIKSGVEVKVMLYHKPLKSFFACSAKQTQKTTDVLHWVKSTSAVNST